MIGLSVAIGRFLEALFWAILRAGAPIALAGAVAMLLLAGLWAFVAQVRRRRNRRG